MESTNIKYIAASLKTNFKINRSVITILEHLISENVFFLIFFFKLCMFWVVTQNFVDGASRMVDLT